MICKRCCEKSGKGLTICKYRLLDSVDVSVISVFSYRDTNQAASEENDYNVFNKAYVFDNTEEFLTPNDLLSFARQIALGMVSH